MIKAELGYNPYVIETKIRFNGREPRINSQVEKYQEFMLQTWIDRIPQIFYDEMNGYDFELDFSGTKVDYEELEKVLEREGLLGEDIRLFYRNELDGRYVKVDVIDQLLKWLSLTPNRKFDYEQFMDDNRELFQHNYPFIVISDHSFDMQCFNDTTISVETLYSVSQLENTNLLHTPILFYLDLKSVNELQKQLRIVRSRNDVLDNQIFFMIDGSLDHDMVERIIIDLGVKEPQIVNAFDDEIIMHYIEVYPVTDYIVNALHVFRENIHDILEILDEENRRSEIQNRSIHEEIDAYAMQIDLLREAYDNFFLRDNLSIPEYWMETKSDMLSEVENWRIRKTKTTKGDEAVMLAKELGETAQKAFYGFLKEMSEHFLQYKNDLENQYLLWYESGNMDTQYDTGCKINESMISKIIPSIAGHLLNIKEENFLMPKEDILGRFFRSSPSDEEKKPVLETTFLFQKWREYVVNIIEPVAQEVVTEYFERIKKFESQLAEKYSTHLEELIADQDKKKEIASSKLSDEEQKLQIDNDWIEDFENQVKVIERG